MKKILFTFLFAVISVFVFAQNPEVINLDPPVTSRVAENADSLDGQPPVFYIDSLYVMYGTVNGVTGWYGMNDTVLFDTTAASLDTLSFYVDTLTGQFISGNKTFRDSTTIGSKLVVITMITVPFIDIADSLRLNGVTVDAIIQAKNFTGPLGNPITGARSVHSDTVAVGTILLPKDSATIDIGSEALPFRKIISDSAKLHALLITDATNADTASITDDGDTTRFTSDNPIKIQENSLIIEVDGSIYAGTTGNVKNYLDPKIFNDSTVTGEITFTDIIPQGYAIESILFKNSANEITNFDIGFSDGGGEVVAVANIAASGKGRFMPILNTIDDAFDGTDTLYISADNWNSATLIIWIRMVRFF